MITAHRYFALFLYFAILTFTGTTASAKKIHADAEDDLTVIKQRLYKRYLINSPGSKEPVVTLLKTLQPDRPWCKSGERLLRLHHYSAN